MSDEQEHIFTFGFGHVHPDTGEPLRNCFVRIHGTHETAREKVVQRFGLKWAFQYDSEMQAGVQKYSLREIAL